MFSFRFPETRGVSLLLAVLLAAPAVSAQQPIRHVDLTSIQAQAWHATAYDAARERVVLFGQGETWEWDGASWLQRSPVHAPAETWGAGMAYDESRRRVVLFGGPGETWEWDGSDWLQLLPATSPAPRVGHSMVYDAARRRVLLYGGSLAGGHAYWNNLDDTWEWDGVDWQQRSPTRSPAARCCGAMAYDASRQMTVLYGGYSIGMRYGFPFPEPQGDSWEWDGSDWRQTTAAGLPAFDGALAAYDVARRRITLVGCSPLGLETWDFDGTTWTAVGVAGNVPGRRYRASVAYDAARGETVLFGGLAYSDHDPVANCNLSPPQPVETWGFDGTSWVLRHLGDEGRAAVGAYDSVRDVLVSLESLRGPCGGTGFATREWGGGTWKRPAAAPAPSPGAALAFDAARGLTVLFGQGETWEWNGVAWQQRPTAAHPSPRWDVGMAFDAQRGVTVLFGGFHDVPYLTPVHYDDTWEWDGATWRQRAPTNLPPGRRGHAMAFDPVRGRTVLHGGSDGTTTLADTWEWDGTDWRQVAAGGPPAASWHGLTWDPSRSQVVTLVRDELWGFDGAAWARIQTSAPLPAANGRTLIHHRGRGALVVVGGGRVRLLGDVRPATATTVGRGCAGSAGVPDLQASPPRLGTSGLRLVVDGALPHAPTVVALSAVQQSTTIAGVCTWYLGASASWSVTHASGLGHAETSLDIPVLAALRGVDLWSQAVVADPGSRLGSFALSPAVRLQLGD